MDLNEEPAIVEDIVELLSSGNVKMVVLVGKPGIGKTWTAERVRDNLMGRRSFDLSVWLCLSRKHDTTTLLESMAAQLYVSLPTEEWDGDNDDSDVDEDEDDENVVSIHDNLKKKITEAIHGKSCLLILDDISKDVLSDFKSMFDDTLWPSFTVLVTSREMDYYNEYANVGGGKVIQIQSFSLEDTKAFLREKVSDLLSEEIVFDSIAKKTNGVPAVVLAFAEALNYIVEHKFGIWTRQQVINSAVRDANSIMSYFLNIAYEILQTDDLIRCFWYGWNYFQFNGPVHFAQLMAHWIIEGCLGHVDCIQEAFEKGYSVLLQLVDCGLLKPVEANSFVMTGAVMKVAHCWSSNEGNYPVIWSHLFTDAYFYLGMVTSSAGTMWEGFGDVAQIDGVIRTVGYSGKLEKISTLLLDANRLCKEDPDKLFLRLKDLHVLGIFNPMLKSLPASLSRMRELTVLIIRGCEFLENINLIRELKSLHVFDIAGATSLATIPYDLFEEMLHLQSLNLSATQIRQLPGSLSELTELRWLILRGCPYLAELPCLNANKLEVLDLSGASSLKTIPQNIFMCKKLRILDLSHSQIDHLPPLSNLQELTQLLLSNCKRLAKLPELSGCCNLQILDISETAVHALPSITCNLSRIILKNCFALTKLPSTKSCKNLVVLDVSGSSNLLEFEDESFSHLRWLCYLNLSNTKIQSLPSLSFLINLRHLLLRDCKLIRSFPAFERLENLELLDLTNAVSFRGFSERYSELLNLRQLLLAGCSSFLRLPNPNNLENLEVLDLSGCSVLSLIDYSLEDLSALRILKVSGIQNIYFPFLRSLSKLEELVLSDLGYLGEDSTKRVKGDFLTSLKNLRILNLSHTPLYPLPSVSRLCNLTHLMLRGWLHLKEVEDLEALTRLEVLDLSETAVTRLPSLRILCNLQQLLLRDCKGLYELLDLDSLSQLEVLDLWGTGIKRFPYEISELTHLKRLDLPFITQKLDQRRIKRLPEELNWTDCGIFERGVLLPENSNYHYILLRGSKFFKFLDKYPNLWKLHFKQFHFSVLPPVSQGENDFFCYRDEPMYGYIYSRTRHFSYNKTFFEVHGSYNLLDGFEGVLGRAEFICLCDNSTFSCFLELGKNSVREMKFCWLERCSKVERIFSGQNMDIDVSDNLEVLWISYLTNLKEISRSETFRNLKHLYLDCCPELENIFSPSRLPRNLEILQIKFCDKLKSVFEFDSNLKCCLPLKLHTLHLYELPELMKIGAALPSLVRLTGGECPKLENSFSAFFLFTQVIQNWRRTKSPAIEEQAILGLPKLPWLVNRVVSRKFRHEITNE